MTRQYVPLPAELSERMRHWREGIVSLPQEYIEFHKKLAEAAKAELSDYSILNEAMVDDGWCDGMKFLAVSVQHKQTGELAILKWADNQCWYSMSECGGWSLTQYRAEEFKRAA